MAQTETFTRDQVSKAATLIRDDRQLFPFEDSDSIRVNSFIDLAVNATMSLLDQPGMSLDDVIRANWQPEDDEQDVVEMVRGWVS